MASISNKKPVYRVSPYLRQYLIDYQREIDVPLTYVDLFHYDSSIALTDAQGNDTMWETVLFRQADESHIHYCLKKIYALLKVDGDISVMKHLKIDRVDLCTYGNTKPFRVRVVNQINDLFDYFYIKEADASRIYGLELEHLLSPNKINFLVKGDTLIEEHIPGVPGDTFIKEYIGSDRVNAMRMAKEFIKFNERCLVQLLGDMRGDNFVVEVVPDFDEVYYRMRAIDFDQQSYDGRRSIYMPQYFKENNPIVALGINSMAPELEKQYRKEERSRIATRVKAVKTQLNQLLDAMGHDQLSSDENVDSLKYELADLYKDNEFMTCRNMGEIVKLSLKMLLKKPTRTVSPNVDAFA